MKHNYLLLLFTAIAMLCSCGGNGGSDTAGDGTGKLNAVAAILFKNVKSKLSILQKNELADSLHFVLSKDTVSPFADSTAMDFPFSATAYPLDLNNDGIEEVFVTYGNTFTSGNTGVSIELFVAGEKGSYERMFDFPGLLPEVLKTSNLNYPDLLIGGPGFEFPVYSWNGKKYELKRSVADKDYSSLPKTNAEEISKIYQAKIK